MLRINSYSLVFFLVFISCIFSLKSQDLVTTLTQSPTTQDFSRFGAFMDITDDGEYIVSSSYLYDTANNDAGLVQIFKKNGDNWDLILSDSGDDVADDEIGTKIAITRYNDLIFIAAGAPQTSKAGNGYVRIYVYDENASAFSTTGLDLNNDGDITDANEGKDFLGDGAADIFGDAIAFSGDGSTLAISAKGYEPLGGSNTGHIRVYKFQNDVNKTWREITQINDIVGINSSQLGAAVALNNDGTRLLATSAQKSHFVVYDFDGTNWTSVGTTSSTYDEDDSIFMGYEADLSSDGERIVIGAWGYDTPGTADNIGFVKIFNYDAAQPSKWNLSATITGTIGSLFGSHLDMSPDGSKFVVSGQGAGNRDIFESSDGINWTAKSYDFGNSSNLQPVKMSQNFVLVSDWKKSNFAGEVNIYSIVSSPTLTITSNVDKINNINSPVITFTSNKDTNNFTVTDISVTSGSISNFTSTSSKVYTVNYTPPINSTGTVTFTVADNAFTDSDGSGNISSTLSISFDTISPTLSSFTHDHDDLIVNGDETVLLTATFSENMTSTPTISIGGIVNDVINEEMTSTSSSVWTFSWNVPSAKNGDFSATVSGTDLFGNYYAGTDSITFDVDNYFDFTLTEDDADNVFTIGEEVTFTLTTTETLSSTVTGSAEYPNPVYNFTNSYSPDTDTSWSRTFSHPPGLTGVVTVTVTASDLATNVVSKTYTYNIDTSAPTINNISSPMTNGTYTDYDGNNALSDTVTITVTFTEAVFVTGTPRLLLDTSPASYVYYFDGSRTTTLTFKSTVDEEVRSTDLNINDLELNGGTIVDSSSNTASLTLAYVTSNTTNLTDNKDIVLDAKNPTLSNYALSDNNNLAPIATFAVNDGDEATFSFESDKELLASSFTVTFTGFTPTLTTVLNTNLGGGQYG
ncbi:MAG: Ig-like domain-containing protein, partial [Bacteroidia bacterium]